MKFTFVIAILAALLVVEAAPFETNAQRMARGLPPLYPANLKRGTPVDGTLFHLLPKNSIDLDDIQSRNAVNRRSVVLP